MKKNNIILYGGKNFGNLVLNYMIKNQRPEYLIPNLDDNGKDNVLHESTIKIARNNDIKIINNKKLIKLCKEKPINYIICAGTTVIIPQEILNSCKNGAINFHPSLLPKYRGRYSTVHAIFNGEKYTGVTCHWISSEIDKGNIIYQKKFKIQNSHTAKDLYAIFTNEAFKLFKRVFSKILKNKQIKSKKIKAKKKYIKKYLPNKGQIDWSWRGKKIFNFIKSMTYEPFEPPSFFIGSRKFYITEEKLMKKKFLKSPR